MQFSKSVLLVIEYSIHPPIGVARVGNSPSEFYLSPTSIGGRPIMCNSFGDEVLEDNKIKYVTKFKDKQKRVKRQAAKFRIFKQDSDNPQSKPQKVDLNDKNEVKSVKWFVHLANKKSVWYHFTEFAGDLMIGKDNTYEFHHADTRNSDIEEPKKRRQLIIDFGYRTLDSPRQVKKFQNDDSVPAGYSTSLPYHQIRDKKSPRIGKPVKYLGEVKTDSKNNLIVLGGYGNAGGDEPYRTFAGGEGWYDDISDGPVLCEITLANDEVKMLDAWVIVGPPKFAPELVNITTLDDTMFDVSVRYLYSVPQMYSKESGWNQNFIVNYEHDIEPILKRIGHYRWVANVPSMMDFCMPAFDLKDNSEKNKKNRKAFFNYFRRAPENESGYGGDAQILFSNKTNEKKNDYINGIPLMPLNCGSNAVDNHVLDKFVTLSRTQYFLLEQWSEGKFTAGKSDDILGMIPLDHADIGNCVGAPMCPGVEVTWSVRNPSIYSKPFHIKHKTKNLDDYTKVGLDPKHDETAPLGQTGGGCEPGDLTKRMAIPWMSDLFECNVNHINFTDVDKNLNPETDLEAPPMYYSYWWPPQAPWDVILGITDPEEDDDEIKRKEAAIKELEQAGVFPGQQVNYIRGIHSHMQMVRAWWHLGFIVNQNEDEHRDEYPYFVEKERNHEQFEVVALAAGNRANIVGTGVTRFAPGFYLKDNIGETL